MRAVLVARTPSVVLPSVGDVLLPTLAGALRLRLYRPAGCDLPVALFLHGGGWTLNDLDTHDDLCRRLAKRSGWLLASIDYRRAPEHKHPAALEDAYVAYRWLLDNAASIGCEPMCPALVGESSGGTMAASLSLLLDDIGAPMPSYQILAYPVADSFGRWPSYTERGNGYILDRDQLGWFFDNYLPAGQDLADRYLFPLTSDDLSNLPSTLVITAEFDPLRDEGIAYAEKLSDAGVSVHHEHVDDQMHGFLLHSRAITKANGLIDYVADGLARVFTKR